MSKYIFIALFFIANLGFSQTIKVKLDRYGLSMFDRYNKKKHALPLYAKGKNEYYAKLPIRYFNDTLELLITKKKNAYFPSKIVCTNQKEGSWEFNYDKKERLITVKENDLIKVTHLYNLSEREGRLISASNHLDKVNLDTLEWIGIERKRIKYGTFNIENKTYSIAVVDLDSKKGSFISIDTSMSIYRRATNSARVGSISEIRYLDFEGGYYKIKRINIDFVELEKCEKIVEDSTIYFDTQLRAFSYFYEEEELDIRVFLKDGKYIVINIFSEYCPPCIKNIPKFNELQEKYKDKVVFLGLFDGVQEDLTVFEGNFNIKYPLGLSSPEIKRDVIQGGFPYKVVVSPEGEILLLRPTLKKVEEFLENLN